MKRADEGTVTVFVTVFMIALLLVAGLVIDGGHVLAARREASTSRTQPPEQARRNSTSPRFAPQATLQSTRRRLGKEPSNTSRAQASTASSGCRTTPSMST